MVIYPDKETIENHKSNETILCYAYENDLIQIYDFYCARYKNITYKEFMNLGITEIQRKISSIPENEPLYNILKSRIINLTKIKNKDERKYWAELKEKNRIPDIYIPSQELDMNLNKKFGGLKDGKKFM